MIAITEDGEPLTWGDALHGKLGHKEENTVKKVSKH
jgi:alpha-tubulin suppressor-like RCC1 family protein